MEAVSAQDSQGIHAETVASTGDVARSDPSIVTPNI